MNQLEDYIVPVIACVPASVAITLLASPLWIWFEETTGVEAIGHFGPSAWCFFITYVAVFLLVIGSKEFIEQFKNLKA